MTKYKFKRQNSHEYTCDINENHYRMTKMAKCQNWDIDKYNPNSIREYDLEVTFTTLRECKDYLSEIHKVDIIWKNL